MKFIFFGAGYCSNFIYKKLPKESLVIGTHNNEIPKKYDHSDKNIKRYTWKDFVINKEYLMKDVTHFLVSIPPNENGDVVLNEIEKDIIGSNKIKWIGFFSSTGVYGNHDGNWVRETSELKTKNLRSINRIKAEKQYLRLFNLHEIPIHIFRLPGIYGPYRSAFDRVKNKNAKIIKKENHFFSRIYVKDIADCVAKSINNPTPGEIFNLTDDLPSSSEEVIIYACSIMGIKIPSIIEFDDSVIEEKTKSFYYENKKVSDLKLKEILKWSPRFKNYKEGLMDILKNSEKN